MSIKDRTGYAGNKVSYAFHGLNHGVLTVLKVICFLPAKIFGFLYFHPFISGIILFFVTGFISTRYFVYPNADNLAEMLQEAASNPNGFFGAGNNKTIIIVLAVIFTILLTLVNIPLGKFFTGIYSGLVSADSDQTYAMNRNREKDIYYRSKAKAADSRENGAEEIDEFKKKLGE